MIKKISTLALALTLLTSCVSKKLYTELEDKYAGLKMENRSQSEELEKLSKSNNRLNNDLEQLQSAYDKALAERDKLNVDYKAAEANLNNLKASYNCLLYTSDAADE